MRANETDRDGPPGADCLRLDAHTLEDLAIFSAVRPDAGSAETATSLFDYCNRTRTEGGARALRRRMRAPWATVERIAATQAALGSIGEAREAFAALPTAWLTGGIDRYLRAGLPLVAEGSGVEFALGAISLWADDQRRFRSIVHGVQLSCRLVAAMRAFVSHPGHGTVRGELATIFEELRGLLDETDLRSIPDEEPRSWPVTILRLDVRFRRRGRAALERLLELAWEIDALVAMSDVSREPGFVMPTVEAGALAVHAQDLVHPLVPEAVGNPVTLDADHRVLFLSGPNMAGKTTYLRAIATAVYFAHLGMGVPARSFRFSPAQCLFSALSLRDDLQGGISYFRAEALRVKAVAQAVADGLRVIAIMDEPFKGTNVKDALDASKAVMRRLAAVEDGLFLFSSHLIELEETLAAAGRIDFRYFEAQEDGARLAFDYRLHAGVSGQRLGMRVLSEEGVFDLLDGS